MGELIPILRGLIDRQVLAGELVADRHDVAKLSMARASRPATAARVDGSSALCVGDDADNRRVTSSRSPLSIPKIPSWGRRDYSLMTRCRSRLRIDDSISGRRRIGLQRRT